MTEEAADAAIDQACRMCSPNVRPDIRAAYASAILGETY